MTPDKINEAFEAIPGFPGYQINRLSDVYSEKTGRILIGTVTNKGYRSHCLILNNKPKVMRTHRLVAMTFLGLPQNDTHQVNHKDGDKLNNCVENLEWVTPQENIKHSIEVLGSLRRGEGANLSKLNDLQVLTVKTFKFHSGWGTRKLSKHFGVNETTIRRIKWNNAWKHI
jgi:hypothetical protein